MKKHWGKATGIWPIKAKEAATVRCTGQPGNNCLARHAGHGLLCPGGCPRAEERLAASLASIHPLDAAAQPPHGDSQNGLQMVESVPSHFEKYCPRRLSKLFLKQ